MISNSLLAPHDLQEPLFCYRNNTRGGVNYIFVEIDTGCTNYIIKC